MAAEKETKKEAETKSTASTSNEKPTAASPSTVPAAALAPAPAPVSAPSISEPKPSTPAVEKAEAADAQRNRQSVDRDVALAHVEQEKRFSFIKAWEESEKTKALNKAQKRLSALDAWENSKVASVEAKMKEIEEELQTKKAEYAEKMKNMVALIHKQSEEKRAMVQARKGEAILTIEEKAAKYRATGYNPKKFLGCLSF